MVYSTSKSSNAANGSCWNSAKCDKSDAVSTANSDKNQSPLFSLREIPENEIDPRFVAIKSNLKKIQINPGHIAIVRNSLI